MSPTPARTPRAATALAALAGAALACAPPRACGRAPSGPPWPAVESLQRARIEPGFRIEPFAEEPALASPVAMEFDEDGRIFVVEMPGYPLDTRPTGRVKLLEDRDGDGRPDRATVFADGLVLPTGLMRWKRGVVVTAAPDVLYLEDADGDGRAESRHVLLTGFALTNPQHTVNSPLYGLDNWVYLAHEGPAEAIIFKDVFGDRGRGVRAPARPEQPPLEASRHGVRFRPDTLEVETLSGRSQFGHAFDEWGRYFTLDNSNHVRHEVIAERYLRRNPDLLLASAMQDVSDHGTAAVVYPISRNPRLELLTEPGQFTSACSLTFVLGGSLAPGLAPGLGRTSLVAEPVHNLVHRDAWSPEGATFVARRVRDGVEFLASADPWFRPVNFALGPDGAVYVVDYYRPMIEHPEWTSSHHHHDSPALYQGSDRGRIHRIAAEGQGGPRVEGPLPGRASTEELVAMLAHDNAWWRRTAQRLLVERRPPEATALLERLFRESRSPLGRLHALWTLEGLGRLGPALVAEALGDEEAGVRESALRLAEPRLPGEAALGEKLLALVDDPDGQVRFQLLCTLGGLDSPRARAAQDRLLLEGIEDRWMQVAALSASSDRAPAYFERALARRDGLVGGQTPGRAAFFRQVASVIGARRRPAEVARVVRAAAAGRGSGAEWWRAASLEGLAEGLRRRRAEAAVLGPVRSDLLALAEGGPPSLRRPALDLLGLGGLPSGPAAEAAVLRASARAADPSADPAARAEAIGLMALAGVDAHAGALRPRIDPREPEPVQLAAVKALARSKDPAVGPLLIDRWRALTPAVRSEAAEALLADTARTRLLLAALKDGRIQPWTLGFWHKHDLVMNEDASIRLEARALLEERPGEREKVVARYQAALEGPADATRGARVFEATCAKCHRFRGHGTELGPDLGTVRNRPAALLLRDILVPSASIAQGYESWVVERASGGTEVGVLAGQTPTSVLLRREGSPEILVPREDIRRRYVSDLSAMPADLEQQVGEREMADLIAYLTARDRP